MEKTKFETKKTSKKVPIICLILSVMLGPFNSTLGGFFLLVSFLSFLICRMQEFSTSGSTDYGLGDRDLPAEKDSDMFAQQDVFESNCSTSIDLYGEVEITPRGIDDKF